MGAIARLLGSLERVLAQLERVLADWLPTEVGASDFVNQIAFRWESGPSGGRVVPIPDPALFDLDDLMGVDSAVESLDRNTRQFMAGLPFNNVLLYGERGTGKSSAARGILARYADRGLRMVEVERRDLVELPRLLEWLRGSTGYHFIVYCDDLSFAPGETGHRELKAALEGSLQPSEAHIMIVATSNRRHLVPETMADNRQAKLDEDGELHLGEALDEKLALADRFGLTLGFFGFDQNVYLDIVGRYLVRAGFPEIDDLTRENALRWALARGNRSGRTARQFVDDVVGQRRLANLSPDEGDS